MTSAQHTSKSNSFNISEQVKIILHARGLSKVFNYSDYYFFKARVRRSFNKAQAIAALFIQEHSHESDLNEYIF